MPISVAVTSGLVFTSSQRADAPPRIVLGAVVTLATRLQSRIGAGDCVVSRPVYRQTRGVFRFDARSLHLLEQGAPIVVYQLQGIQARPQKRRGIEGLHAQLVGRSDELHTLQTLAEQVQQGAGQLAAIIGEAGVGKSRLAMEFHGQLSPCAPAWLWLEGRCQEMAQGAGYAPFVDLLRTYWGWRPEESDATRTNSITALLADLHQDQHLRQEQVSEIGAVLGRLLGLRYENEWDRLLDQADPYAVQRRTASALCQLFVALSQRQPLILTIEDLHWADSLSLDLIHSLMEPLPHAAIFLLCLYRPEQQRRSWQLAAIAAHACPGHFCQIDLHELTPEQSRLLIANLLRAPPNASRNTQAEALAPAVKQMILDRAQGNPLYLEELVYSLIDSGMLIRQATGWRTAAEVRLSAVPESLQSIIFTRLDALGSPWKQVLQRAAVLGRTFRRRLLAELTPSDIDLDDALQRLIDAMFIYQERLFPEEEYSFRHVLVQEAIHHGLTQRQRRLLHRQVAQCVEEMAGARLQEQIDLLAHHWSQAGEPAPAIHYLLLAGDKAQAALAYHEAADYYRRAVGFLKQQADQPLTARTLMKLGNSLHSAGEFRRAWQAFDDCFVLQRQAATASTVAPVRPTQTLRLAWGEPDTLNPTVAENVSTCGLADQFFSSLVGLGPDFEVVPAVAERWEVLAGGRRYIFHLRQDVLWDDGVPVTAHDFVAAWQLALAPASQPNLVTFFTLVKHAQAFHAGTLTDPAQLGIQAVDDFTLVVELEQPGNYFLQMLSSPAAKPIPRHVLATHGEAWVQPEHFVGNGPFRLADWQAGKSMTLERSPLFYGVAAGDIGRVELAFDLNAAQQRARYEADQLDLLWLSDFDAAECERLRQRHPAEYLSSPLFNVIFVDFEVTRPPFDDPRVRQAFIHAVDREALVDGALGGVGQPAHGGFVPFGMPGHSPSIGLKFDPGQACKLLDAAGYADRSQFPLLTGLAWQGLAPMCAALSAAWGENLGLPIEWRILDYYDFLRTWQGERPPLFLFGFAGDFPDAGLMLDKLVSTDITRWSNAEFLHCFEQAQKTQDPARRLALLAQADAIAMAEAAVMPLYYERLQFLLKPHVRRYPLSPTCWWFWKDVEKMGKNL